MRFVFHNPHALWFKETVPCFISRTRDIGKYDYMFDWVYRNNRKVSVLLNQSCSSPVFQGILKRLNFPILEFYFWVLLNRLNPLKFNIYTNSASFDKDDIVFSFLYNNLTYVDKSMIQPHKWIKELREMKAYKILHLSHYGYNASFGSKNAFEAGINLLVSESNLYKNSEFFRQKFNWYSKDVLILPFFPQKRFVNKTPFKDRVNKALSTGTNTYKMVDNDFETFFKDNRLQPLRAEIMNKVHELEPYIDSIIAHIKPEKNSASSSRKSKLIHFWKTAKYVKHLKLLGFDLFNVFRILFHYSPKPKKNDTAQEYFKIDIVEKYNQYKMFVVPEEIIGLPGIGFIEGIACGSAYIGIRHPMYSDLGFIDNVHYIGYDGSLEDMKRRIRYYQQHEDELERIAASGYEFVMENFAEDRIMKDFMNYLESMNVSNI